MGFDLNRSLERARERFGDAPPRRRPRSDRGRSRLPVEVLSRLHELLQTQERLPVREIVGELGRFCDENGLGTPSRATIYEQMRTGPVPVYAAATLPESVRETLYNVADDAEVPGHQLAFHCCNYGGTAAVSFAAGLPWLALYQAARLRGWRSKSRGLLTAILRVRSIE